jgi:hypothetical protein
MKYATGAGLLLVLGGVALMLFLYAGPIGPGGSSYIGTVAEKKADATEQAQQFSGRDIDGRPLSETLTLEPFEQGGNLRGLTVVAVEPEGVAATHFGLQAGDIIEQIGPQEVGGFIIDSFEFSKDMLNEAFARQQTVVVERNGEEVTLPLGDRPGNTGLPGLNLP